MPLPGDEVRKEKKYRKLNAQRRAFYENGDATERPKSRTVQRSKNNRLTVKTLTPRQMANQRRRVALKAAAYNGLTRATPDFGQIPKKGNKYNHRQIVQNVKRFVDDSLEPDGDPQPSRYTKVDDIIADNYFENRIWPGQSNGPVPGTKSTWVCLDHAKYFAFLLRALHYPVREVNIVFLAPNGEYGHEAVVEVWYNGKWHVLDPYLCQTGYKSILNHLKIKKALIMKARAGGIWTVKTIPVYYYRFNAARGRKIVRSYHKLGAGYTLVRTINARFQLFRWFVNGKTGKLVFPSKTTQFWEIRMPKKGQKKGAWLKSNNPNSYFYVSMDTLDGTFISGKTQDGMLVNGIQGSLAFEADQPYFGFHFNDEPIGYFDDMVFLELPDIPADAGDNWSAAYRVIGWTETENENVDIEIINNNPEKPFGISLNREPGSRITGQVSLGQPMEWLLEFRNEEVQGRR